MLVNKAHLVLTPTVTTKITKVKIEMKITSQRSGLSLMNSSILNRMKVMCKETTLEELILSMKLKLVSLKLLQGLN